MKDKVKTILDEVESMNPYKKLGDRDTYSKYNEGWSDACDIIRGKVKSSIKYDFGRIIESGIYFGYPLCCIKEYLNDIENKKSPGYRTRDISKKTGFSPCSKHSDMIREGKLKIEDLIDSRVCSKSFPERHSNDLSINNKF